MPWGMNVSGCFLLPGCWFARDVMYGGHVGGQEQKHFSPLGAKVPYHVNYSGKNSIALSPNVAALSVVANQE